MARREAFKMYLKKGFEKEYEWRHSNIWPEVKAKNTYYSVITLFF